MRFTLICTYICIVALIPRAIAATTEQAPPACKKTYEPATGGYQFVEANQHKNDLPEHLVIGKIHYTRLEIFNESDPGESYRLYRWANRFHILTKPEVIQNQILFAEGDVYDERLIRESSRILRSRKYLYDAAIKPIDLCNNTVDLEVVTRDLWSFTPGISFNRSGGENTFRISLRDTNIFGSGNEVAIATQQDLDRDSNEFTYKNNSIGGSRVDGRIYLADNDDGNEQFLGLNQPFFALDSRHSWGIRFNHYQRVDTQFSQGSDVSEVTHEAEDYMLHYGFSRGLENGVSRRWSFGYQYQNDVFSQGEELPPPTDFPTDKRLSYPFIEYASVADDYITASNLDQIHRTEDLHLGHSFAARLGYAASEFGSDQNRILAEGTFGDTMIYDGNILWWHSLEWRGLWNLDSDNAEDIIVSYQTKYFRHQTSHRSFFARFNATYSKNLNTNQQIVLGGETGARGFDNRFQVGTRSVLLSLEERFYSDLHFLNILRPGWAIFFDLGRAWDPDVEGGFEDDYLADIGFGLRFASTKAASGRIIHIDLAFPLTNKDHPEVDSSVLSVSIKSEF